MMLKSDIAFIWYMYRQILRTNTILLSFTIVRAFAGDFVPTFNYLID